MKFLSLFLMLMTTQAFAQTKATLKLFRAIEKNDTTLAKNALKDGADVNGVDNLEAPKTTVLLKATQLGRLEIVNLLLDNHADINIRRPVDMHTPLMIAASKDHGEIAALLIAKGAEVNLETTFTRTALQISALRNSLSVAQELVKSANIDVNSSPRNCALAIAAKMGHTGIVLLLKRQTGSKTSSPVCVDAALQNARHNNHDDVVLILSRN